MTTEVGEKLYTIPEFLALEWPDDDENEYELIGGRVVAKPLGGVSGKHGKLVARLAFHLNKYLESNPIAEVYAQGSCMLGQPESRPSFLEPDISVVLNGRTLPDFSGPIPVAPDLVVEVWSPSDTDSRRQEKIEVYQQAEVRLIWSIHMLQKYVVVYRLNDPDTKFYNAYNGILDGDEVLPGFQLSVSKLFE
jgi:Uma2 family endonuclease